MISAGRRSDIPAFYADWFMDRLKAGYVKVPNPFDRRKIQTINLAQEAVDGFVFWTRNPRPLFRRLDELDRFGKPYAFLVTLTGLPRSIEPHSPPLETVCRTIRDLAKRIGKGRIVWRYDPVVLAEGLDAAWHLTRFREIAGRLAGLVDRCVLSFYEPYRKTRKRMAGVNLLCESDHALAGMLGGMVDAARAGGFGVRSCAEPADLAPFGILPNACIDPALLGLPPSPHDPHQRPHCRCAPSKDVSVYDSCLFGCRYCYAVGSFELARRRFPQRRRDGESLDLI